jgi:hypothetical protein
LEAPAGSDGVVVVVGATGIFRPLVSSLRSAGTGVVAIARGESALAHLSATGSGLPGGLWTFAHDARDPAFPEALDALLQGLGLVVAATVIYRPATSAGVVSQLVENRRGVLVEVLTSGVAQPQAHRPWVLSDLPETLPHHRRIVLGWHAGAASSPPEATGWHTAEEISASVLAALTEPGGDHLLGVVSPWDERPRR